MTYDVIWIDDLGDWARKTQRQIIEEVNALLLAAWASATRFGGDVHRLERLKFCAADFPAILAPAPAATECTTWCWDVEEQTACYSRGESGHNHRTLGHPRKPEYG